MSARLIGDSEIRLIGTLDPIGPYHRHDKQDLKPDANIPMPNLTIRTGRAVVAHNGAIFSGSQTYIWPVGYIPRLVDAGAERPFAVRSGLIPYPQRRKIDRPNTVYSIPLPARTPAATPPSRNGDVPRNL